MLRGVGGRNIFEDDHDRARFCLLLQYASETSQFDIHGFCFMGNHVHLLLQPHTEDLSSGMHRLTFRYAQYYNKKVQRQGYLFQGRFKDIPVENGSYLLRVIRYIHRNPIRAKLVSQLSDYRWSSHTAYTEGHEYTWLKKDYLLSHFEKTTEKNTLESFKKYIQSEDAEAKIELEEIQNSIEIGAFGCPLFVQEHLEKVKPPTISREWATKKFRAVSNEYINDLIKRAKN